MSDEPVYYMLSYVNRDGASCGTTVTAKEALAKLKKLRAPAQLTDANHKVVGGCEEVDNADDRRIRWNWWMESDLP